MKPGPAMYRERTWAPPWVVATLVVACLVSVGPLSYAIYGHVVLGHPAENPSARVLIAGGLAIMFAVFFSIFMCLDVEVRSDHLFIALGPIHLVRRRIRYSDVEAVSAVIYRPIREFGGWGVRWWGGKTAWTIRGNRAVKVELRSGKAVYVGSRYPQRLAGRIEAAMAVR